MICPICDKEILPEEKRKMIGVDKPYMNVFFHRDCLETLEISLIEYLTQNVEKCYNIYIKSDRKVKNGK